jgi:hypothetical protein
VGSAPADRSEINGETLGLIYDHLRDAPGRRIEDGQRQESKAVSLFAAATVLIGLAGISLPRAGDWHWLVVLLSVGVALAYAVAVGATAFTLWPRSYRAADYDGSLWRTHWNKEPAAVRHAIVDDITQGSRVNQSANARREVGVYWVLWATAAEGLLVAALLILVHAVSA